MSLVKSYNDINVNKLYLEYEMFLSMSSVNPVYTNRAILNWKDRRIIEKWNIKDSFEGVFCLEVSGCFEAAIRSCISSTVAISSVPKTRRRCLFHRYNPSSIVFQIRFSFWFWSWICGWRLISGWSCEFLLSIYSFIYFLKCFSCLKTIFLNILFYFSSKRWLPSDHT